MKTIYALATPLGGAIAIIRISGDNTYALLKTIFKGRIEHGRIEHGQIINNGKLTDDAMAAFFKSPKSYTGEDMAELYIHGSRAVANEVMTLLAENGAQPAEPGEFSKRAFVNGKMDLSQAEAVMDLINASASRSADSALLQLEGRLFGEISQIEERLIGVLAKISAAIDYPDELDDTIPDISDEISSIRASIEKLIRSGIGAHYIRDGITISVAGAPNAGKSSLMNALIGEDRAIVSDIAGTTRDIIEANTVFCGLPVCLFDTAGLRDTEDKIEKIGVERARDRIKKSDAVILAIDSQIGFSNEDLELLSSITDKPVIIALCKSDLNDNVTLPNEVKSFPVRSVSSLTGEGVEELKTLISELICPTEQSGLITNMRHVTALKNAKQAIVDAENAQELDCASTDLNRALHSIGEITGSSVDERVINTVFEKFCVGK